MGNIYIKNIACITGPYSGTDLPLSEKLNTSIGSDWFDAASYLGIKGHRYYSESVQYTLAAAILLKLALAVPGKNREDHAVFMATNSADQAIREQITYDLKNRSNVTIGAAYAPNCSVNTPASHLSIKYGYHKPCSTHTGPWDAVFFSLWQAVDLMRKKQADSVLVGQVEYCNRSVEKSGAVLWELSTIYDKTAFSCIESFHCARGLEGMRGNIDPNLPGSEETIFLIGQDGVFLNRVKTHLSRNDQPTEWFHKQQLEQYLLPDLFLYSTLSFLIAQKASFSTLIVSNSGHIFYIKLIKGNKQ